MFCDTSDKATICDVFEYIFCSHAFMSTSDGKTNSSVQTYSGFSIHIYI